MIEKFRFTRVKNKIKLYKKINTIKRLNTIKSYILQYYEFIYTPLVLGREGQSLSLPSPTSVIGPYNL
jgi:hypothetical protein